MGLFRSKPKRILAWERKGNLDRLIHALRYDIYDIRILAAEALGRIGDRSAIPFLINGLDDEVASVRDACKKSILQIDPSEYHSNIIKEKESFWSARIKIPENSENTRSMFDKES